MQFAGVRTKKEAVVIAIAEFNRLKRVEEFIKCRGAFPDFPSNDEVEAADVLDAEDRAAQDRNCP